MISFKRLVESCDTGKCINDLIELHRVHYYEPGYLLDKDLLRDKYRTFIKEVLSLYNSGMVIETVNKVEFLYDKQQSVYNLTIDKTLLRDWINTNNISAVASMNIQAPDTLSKEQVLLELIYELTYYEFVELS